MGDCNCGHNSESEVIEPTFIDKILAFFGLSATAEESSAEHKTTPKEEVKDLANW